MSRQATHLSIAGCTLVPVTTSVLESTISSSVTSGIRAPEDEMCCGDSDPRHCDNSIGFDWYFRLSGLDSYDGYLWVSYDVYTWCCVSLVSMDYIQGLVSHLKALKTSRLVAEEGQYVFLQLHSPDLCKPPYPSCGFVPCSSGCMGLQYRACKSVHTWSVCICINTHSTCLAGHHSGVSCYLRLSGRFLC